MRYVFAFIFCFVLLGLAPPGLAQQPVPPTPVQGLRLELPLEMYSSVR